MVGDADERAGAAPGDGWERGEGDGGERSWHARVGRVALSVVPDEADESGDGWVVRGASPSGRRVFEFHTNGELDGACGAALRMAEQFR